MLLKASFLPVAVAVLALGAVPARAQNVQFAGYPDGPGMDILRTKCRVCHMPDRVKQKGREKNDWDALVHNMMNRGADITDAELPVLIDYLSKNWPPGNADEAAPVAVAAVRPMANQVTVNFKEWTVPTPNSHPHDPLAASDGSIWYTGQRANLLGRIDPKTGDIKEFKLKTPESGPHGLTEDKDGNIWYTGNLKAHLGKLNPKTGEITEYPMPDPAARDPHTAVFDQKGNLWFTVQSGNMVGRFNPSNGDLTLTKSPTPQSLPYGIVVSSKGVPFYVEFGANKIAHFKDGKFTEYPLPKDKAAPSGITVATDGSVWFGVMRGASLGRMRDGQMSFVALPREEARPYSVAADAAGNVWYADIKGYVGMVPGR